MSLAPSPTPSCTGHIPRPFGCWYSAAELLYVQNPTQQSPRLGAGQSRQEGEPAGPELSVIQGQVAQLVSNMLRNPGLQQRSVWGVVGSLHGAPPAHLPQQLSLRTQQLDPQRLLEGLPEESLPTPHQLAA